MAFRSYVHLIKLSKPSRLPRLELTTKPALSSLRSHLYLSPQQKRYANGYGSGAPTPGQVGPQPGQPEDPSDERIVAGKATETPDWKPTLFKMFESAATTVVSLFVLG